MSSSRGSLQMATKACYFSIIAAFSLLPLGACGFSFPGDHPSNTVGEVGASAGGNSMPVREPSAKLFGVCGSGLWTVVVPDCFYVAGITGPRRVCFRSACSRHDSCYGMCSKTKSKCDNVFLRKMRRICRSRFLFDRLARWDCYRVARVYFRAVNRWGRGAYDDAQDGCTRRGSMRAKSAGEDTEIWDTFLDDEELPLIFVDNDDDLLPDEWEADMGLDPTDPTDAVEDSDLDGLPNLAEFILDFDPFNNDSDGDGIDDWTEAEQMQEFSEASEDE